MCGPGLAGEFRCWPDTGSALRPHLFNAVVELISRKKYADGLAVVADGEADLQEQLKISLDKTEVMWVGYTMKNLEKDLDGKKRNQNHGRLDELESMLECRTVL